MQFYGCGDGLENQFLFQWICIFFCYEDELFFLSFVCFFGGMYVYVYVNK